MDRIARDNFLQILSTRYTTFTVIKNFLFARSEDDFMDEVSTIMAKYATAIGFPTSYCYLLSLAITLYAITQFMSRFFVYYRFSFIAIFLGIIATVTLVSLQFLVNFQSVSVIVLTERTRNYVRN